MRLPGRQGLRRTTGGRDYSWAYLVSCLGSEWFRRLRKPARRKGPDPGSIPGDSTLADEVIEWLRSTGVYITPWQEHCLRWLYSDDTGYISKRG